MTVNSTSTWRSHTGQRLFKYLADLQAGRLGKRLPYSCAAPGTEHAEGVMSMSDSYSSNGAHAANIAVSYVL